MSGGSPEAGRNWAPWLLDAALLVGLAALMAWSRRRGELSGPLPAYVAWPLLGLGAASAGRLAWALRARPLEPSRLHGAVALLCAAGVVFAFRGDAVFLGTLAGLLAAGAVSPDAWWLIMPLAIAAAWLLLGLAGGLAFLAARRQLARALACGGLSGSSLAGRAALVGGAVLAWDRFLAAWRGRGAF